MLERNIDFSRQAAARPLLRSFVLETCSEVDVRGAFNDSPLKVETLLKTRHVVKIL